MDFYEVLAQAIEILQRQGRTSYRALKRQFGLDEANLDDLKLEIIKVRQLAVDQDGEMLVWRGPPSSPELDGRPGVEAERRFYALLPGVMWMLQRDRRITYRELRHVFGLDEALLAEIRQELAFRQIARDEQGEGLVWTGEAGIRLSGPTVVPETMATSTLRDAPAMLTNEPARSAPEAERRQLTVMFCDLPDSTTLAQQLDAEDLREVIRAYQTTAAEVIQQYEGTIAQYLGDGLLVYFGWPIAHEDDASRAVHAGLGIVEAITTTLNPCLEREKSVRIAVRIGIHTGPVVVGAMNTWPRGTRSTLPRAWKGWLPPTRW